MLFHENLDFWRNKKILIAPLDWGLGHTARCIPIIRELLRAGAFVWLAGEPAQKNLLQQEFPQLPFLSLPGYRISYSKKFFRLNLFLQIPKILRAIRNENRWLKDVLKKMELDLIIADNRYGLFHKNVFCILITHQLRIQSGIGNPCDTLLQYAHYRLIGRFNECWIPDEAGELNLAGVLSHPKKLPPVPIKYIGALSRFQKTETPEIKNHLLIVLSGVEPQRTIFEQKILSELSQFAGSVTVVRGLPAAKKELASFGRVQIFNHLNADCLGREMEKAAFVIGRSGYSTVMDIVALKKKAILIPTKGQTEQEYLAASLHKKQLFFSVSEQEFSLSAVLEKAKKFDYHFFETL